MAIDQDWPMTYFDDHADDCYLQPPYTIPSWCTCDIYKERRIQIIVDAVFCRLPKGAGHYWENVKPGELYEAVRRIRAEQGYPQVDNWYGDDEDNPNAPQGDRK